MKLKTVLLLAVAVGCGLIAMLGVQQSMSGGSAPVEEKVSVLMAVTDINVGEVLTPENCTFRDVSIETAPANSVLTEEEYFDRSALVPLMANDFVTIPKLSEPGVSGTSVQIPKGMRVMTVNVNDTTSHSGMLSAGDRVDVLVTYQLRTARGQTTQTKTLLEFIEVFATGKKTASDGRGESETKIKNISLILSPEQVPYVNLAQKKGTLSLSWRRRDDDEFVKVGTVDEELMSELQGTVDRGANGYDYPSYVSNDPEAQEEKPSLSKWIDQQEEKQAEVEASQPEPVEVAGDPEAPPRPTWKMELFHGEERVEVILELPLEEETEEGTGTTRDSEDTATLADPADPDATQPVSTPAGSTNWQSLLQGLNISN